MLILGRVRGRRQIPDNTTFGMVASEAATSSRHRASKSNTYNQLNPVTGESDIQMFQS